MNTFTGSFSCSKCLEKIGDFIVRSTAYSVKLDVTCPGCGAITSVLKETSSA